MIKPMRKIRIIVIDAAQRDICSFREIWRQRDVELLGPFSPERVTGDTIRRSDGVLIALDKDDDRLQHLVDLLSAVQVPYLFTVQNRSKASAAHFTLDADIAAIDELLEELITQDDDGVRH
jgi:hypothetical protein